MAKKQPWWPKDLTMPLVWSLLLHGGIVAVLALGMIISPNPIKPIEVQLSGLEPTTDDLEETEEIVEAVAVDQSQVTQQVEAIRERERQQRVAEENRIKELERRAAEAERRREQEQQRQRELAQQQERERQKLAEERRKAEAEKDRIERERKEAEAAAQAAAERRKREEQAAKEAEERRKREEAERQKREQAAREKAERERQLQERLAREAQERRTARQQQMQSEIQRYTGLITQTIQRNWIVDESMRGKNCELTIRLASSGFVISVDTGSGDARVCQSARNAVLKAGTLPVSQDPEVFKEMSTIRLTVAPSL